MNVPSDQEFYLAVSRLLALGYFIKKGIELGALVFAAAYLSLLGTAVAPQRVFIMIRLFLIAVLLDREAVAMRLAA
jgi:hypothetical protein